ncbi:MAG: ATP-binding cassette domain-containing protein [Chthoniobacterales bacterium]|nr:ATP-binding cassette domain-containing protein [Chthoniobacterales bacterium]
MNEPEQGREVMVVDNLVQTIGGQEILRGFSLKVHKGETLVLLGRSGGGKSVFLRHLIGLMQPVSGSIKIEGHDITKLKERELSPVRRRIGMLFQNGALFDSLNVADNVAFPLRERGEKDESIISQKVQSALQMVDLHGHQHKMPVNLSGGMRKRVALARALVYEPQCMLYDEPTAGLDPIVADSIDLLVRRLQRRLGVTSIVVTHDMKSTFSIADHVALLHEGRCYFYGNCDQLRASTDPVIRDFVEGRSHETP